MSTGRAEHSHGKGRENVAHHIQWPDAQPTLTDGVITLRPHADADADALFEMFQDPDNQARTRAPSPYPHEAAVAAIESAITEWQGAKAVRFAAIDQAGQLVGTCGLVNIDVENRVAEAGFAVAASARRQGIARRMLTLISDWALNDLGFARVELLIEPENVASLAVARSCDFTATGEIREELTKGQLLRPGVFAKAATNRAATHWDSTYSQGDTGRSWYQPHASTSAELICGQGSRTDSVIDIGGGASTLADDLLHAGYQDLSVLDISATSFEIAQARLGVRSDDVTWLVADILGWSPTRTYDVWHDRAVLHFFTDPDEQAGYHRALVAATHPGSHIVIGVFGSDGPTQCSGLPVQRYDRDSITTFLGSEFDVTSSFTRDHLAPNGNTQEFLWVSAVRR